MIIIHSAYIDGVDVRPIRIEIMMTHGLPGISIIGLPNESIRESRDRIRAALVNTHVSLPSKKIIINLAPASERKLGCTFDLPIAMGLALYTQDNKIAQSEIDRYLVVGELSLDGSTQAIHGSIPIVCYAAEHGWKGVILPTANMQETEFITGLHIQPIGHLRALAKIVQNLHKRRPQVASFALPPQQNRLEMLDVVDDAIGKRALEIAAAGRHHLLLVGDPGCGKTSLAHALRFLLPPLSLAEAFETMKIVAIAEPASLRLTQILTRPFRSPHPTISPAGLLGTTSRPGEVSLAHNGVLFLDEFLEIHRPVIEALRVPLDSARIALSKGNGRLTMPANFQLVLACNPCPCGYFATPGRNCLCSPTQLRRYQQKLSGPILDRIDIRLDISRVKRTAHEKSSPIDEDFQRRRQRIDKAIAIQAQRNGHTQIEKNSVFLPTSESSTPTIRYNSAINHHAFNTLCPIDKKGRIFLDAILKKTNDSHRNHHLLLRVARTIADLESSEVIRYSHLIEAQSMRHHPWTSTQPTAF